MIEVRDLVKHFGAHRAVDGVSFEARGGQVVSLLGPNGAGKTTIMRILTGLSAPTAGVVRLDGHRVTADSRVVRRRLGYLPEHAALYGEMRVEEYLAYRAALKGVARRGPRIEHVLETCDLVDVRRRIIGQLSKGYRQRVSLAAVLLHDPSVLVLDEPTVGLDPLQIRAIRRLVRTLGRENTVLFSTHILAEAEAVSDRVVILQRGRVALDAPVAEISERTAIGWLEIELLGEAHTALAALDALAAGLEVEQIAYQPAVRLRIRRPRGGIDVEMRAAVSRAVAAAGLDIVGMQVCGASLEDAFADLTGVEGEAA